MKKQRESPLISNKALLFLACIVFPSALARIPGLFIVGAIVAWVAWVFISAARDIAAEKAAQLAADKNVAENSSGTVELDVIAAVANGVPQWTAYNDAVNARRG